MTVDEYYAAIRRLGLRPTKVPTVYVTSTMEYHNVPEPHHMTPEQRAETIEYLKGRLGISDRFN
jgi:hypothetical protein